MGNIIAVDFDGTLAITQYPTIIEPIMTVIEFCKEAKRGGDIIILNTCREGKYLQEAVDFCHIYGLDFDYLNENTVENISRWGDCRKISADLYIDDRAQNVKYITIECDNAECAFSQPPKKTRLTELKRIFPKIKLNSAGYPILCPQDFSKDIRCVAYGKHSNQCDKCKEGFWNKEIKQDL